MALLRDALQSLRKEVECSIAAVPKDGLMTINDEDYEANMAAIDAFVALDDVDSIEHNIDLVDED
jgi:transcriptional/translational regulatory protein YebC/TACO1